jgi:DNA-binding LytR/AlgR family response regulator
MLKLLIVEDELLIAEDLRMQLTKLGYYVVGMAVSYMEAIELIMEDLPDLVLLDINIKGDKDGIELGHFLHHEVEIPFIYLTSHSDSNTLARAKETQPDAYLLKPYKKEGLYTAIEIALSNATKRSRHEALESLNEKEPEGEELILKDCLFVKKDHSFIKVKLSEIKYLNSEGNYMTIFVDRENKYLIRSTIKNMLEYIPNDVFFQTHKSYLVNLNFLEQIGPMSVTVSGQEVPLAKNKKEQLLSRMRTLK